MMYSFTCIANYREKSYIMLRFLFLQELTLHT